MFLSDYYPRIPDNWIYKCEPRHIPINSAVYIIIAQSGIVKYVGQTTNLQQRFKDHSKHMKDSDKFGWVLCDSDELCFLECWFIATLRPVLNGKPNKRATNCKSTEPCVLKVKAKHVWSIGQTAVAFQSSTKIAHRGVIEKFGSDLLHKHSVQLSGKWFAKMYVTVVL